MLAMRIVVNAQDVNALVLSPSEVGSLQLIFRKGTSLCIGLEKEWVNVNWAELFGGPAGAYVGFRDIEQRSLRGYTLRLTEFLI